MDLTELLNAVEGVAQEHGLEVILPHLDIEGAWQHLEPHLPKQVSNRGGVTRMSSTLRASAKAPTTGIPVEASRTVMAKTWEATSTS